MRPLLLAFAATLPLVALAVGARWVAFAARAARARRGRLALVALLGFGTVLALLAAVASVWFGYAVAHAPKDLRSDAAVLLYTGAPFLLAGCGLWCLAGRLERRLGRGRARSPSPPPPARSAGPG